MSWLMKHPEVVYSEMEEGAVLLNLESRLYYSLDESGLEVWRSIETARDVNDLCAVLLARFDASETDTRARLTAFVEQLEQERLVIPSDAADAAPAGGMPASTSAAGLRKPLAGPSLLKHDEPLHEMSQHPFDPQLPLAE